ncbi:MAG: aminotransferase class I/II-fold pyridoxal phosphate-dependent enzyme [Candidatus Pacebacteria bacterium]|nr:aminotransferase class I/II-fold pyridoxal phosphate-dependent enzyme [Candidatus Paceibacterota bacterium]MDR3582900.1 aminotransferase class I/II-fold pyridoxal phosphate-dependent enzyme [Candidatus Paceibacterota bacterium]
MFERTQNLKLSVIKQMELRASKFPDVISLAQGVPSFDTPECVKRRVERAMRDGVTAKYSLSPGLPELRELVEQKLAEENMFYDFEKEIIVTAGSIEGITATIMAITNPGDEIIIPEPTYTSYREVIILAGCTPVFVPLNEEKGWALELEKYEAAITSKTKAIFYCNPNNPTGTIYTEEQLRQLAKLAEKYNLYLISDEVYKDFIFERLAERKKIFSLAEIPELRKRVIRLFSFSKSYAMTGWRVGYLHSDESIVKEILKVHDSLVTCAPVVSQYAAMGALEMAEKDIAHFRREYQKRRDLICARLDKFKNVFEYVQPTSAYYVFPKIIKKDISFGSYDCPDSLSWKFALYLLEKAQVAVVPGVAFGPNGEDHVRMSFGRSEKDINRAMDRLEKLFL